MKRLLSLLAGVGALALRGTAQIVVSTPLDLAIPDGGGAVGVQSSISITTPLHVIGDVNVSIEIASVAGDSAWNGDFYAYLSHGGQLVVLLNRIGRTASNPDGSPDNGLQVTFDDQAAGGDIHLHTPVVQPDPTETQLPLTGSWQPDGRSGIHPSSVLDTSPRLSSLANFNGMDPNGEWTLFISDFGTGAAARLVRWELSVVAAVPEPGFFGTLSGVGLIAFGLRRARAS
jgi:hypothetical protein